MNQEIAEVYEIEDLQEFQEFGYCLLLEQNEEYLKDDIIVCFDNYIENLAEYEEALDLAGEFFEPPYV